MTLAASTERIAGFFATYRTLDFTPVVLVEHGDMVTCVWNAELVAVTGEPSRISSIEVFRIADGRIVEVWNAEASSAHWLP
jgi:ketosteroid isomerase-like protein